MVTKALDEQSIYEFGSNSDNLISYSTTEYGTIHRKLESRHVHLISIGGAIGTALFVTIGTGLLRGGPLGILLSYTFWTFIVMLLTSAVGEFVCYLPVSSPFATMAGRCVDKSLECCAGWNFFILQALFIPFEITAVNGMIHFWRDDYSPAITLCIQILIYAAINLFAVNLYGEVEFWLSLGKLILCIGLLFFTLVTMCGGNPKHDAFGFRNWKIPGGPMAEYITTGNLGKFQGFLGSLLGLACFTILGVEYLAMVAAEAKNPRKVMPKAFKSVLIRLTVFYIGGALCVSIVVAYDDPLFVKMASETSNAAASPYVIAMKNMGINALPDIVNVLIITSAFSAGNSYTFCASRVLYGLSQGGFAPKLFQKCTKKGVPVYCILVTICFSLLSLLQLSSASSKVLSYMVNLCTGCLLLNYGFMSITYIGFYRACKAQNINRNTLPYTSWGQPYSIYFTAFFIWATIFILGYACFIPGRWSLDDFLFSYVLVFVNIAIFIICKFWKKTKFIKPVDADLTSGLKEIELHEYHYYSQMKDKTERSGFFRFIF